MAQINFRQGIVKHQTDSLGNPTFLDFSGGAVSLVVSPTPTILTLAQNNKNYLFTEKSSVNNAWSGPFVPGVDYWLYWDINLVTGIRTFGFTTLEPFISANPPIAPQTGQMWWNTSSTTMFVFNGAQFIEAIRVFAAKIENGTTLISLSDQVPKFTGTQVGLNVPNFSGAFVFDTNGEPITNGDGSFFTTEDPFITGVPTGAALKVNSWIVEAITQQPVSKGQIVEFNGFNTVVPAHPLNQNNVIFGMVEEDAVTNERVIIRTGGVVFNSNWNWNTAGINTPLFIDNSGFLQTTAVVPNQLSAAVVIDSQRVILRDPSVLASIINTGSGGGITDHGLLSGLNDDDHPQYLTNVRGDIRYYERSIVDNLLAGKLNLTGGTLTGTLTLASNPTANLEAATKVYVDNLVQGLIWLPPVSYVNVISDSINTPPGSNNLGDLYIVATGGTGAWVGLDGHIVHWNGSGWNDEGLLSSVATGTRVGVSIESSTVASGSFLGQDNNIMELTNPSLGTWSVVTTPTQNNAIWVNNAASLHSFHQYAFSGTGWVEFGGTSAITPGTNILVTGTDWNVQDFSAGGTIEAASLQGSVPTDFTPIAHSTDTTNPHSTSLLNLTDTDLTTTSPVLNDSLTYDGTKWIPQASPAVELPRPYDLAAQTFGEVVASSTLFKFVAPRDMILFDFGHQLQSETLPPVDSDFDITLNGTTIGTARFFASGIDPVAFDFGAAGGFPGTSGGAIQHAISRGDIIRIIAPVTSTTGFNDVSISLRGAVEPNIPSTIPLTASFSPVGLNPPIITLNVTGEATYIEYACVAISRDSGSTWYPLDANGYTPKVSPTVGILVNSVAFLDSESKFFTTTDTVLSIRETNLTLFGLTRYRIQATVYGPAGIKTAFVDVEYNGV